MRTVLLVIGGGIAAYKSLDLIRRLKERGYRVRPILTAGGAEFVTDLAVGALAHETVYGHLWSREDEQDVGHIRLAREADAILVAPATANMMARLANGHADDLATACILAARCPVLLAPAMNPTMWDAEPTRRNVRQLGEDGAIFVGPDEGEMAERGERGFGRMSEPVAIADAVDDLLEVERPLRGLSAVVTSGPTREPIDPVRYISNHSSGKQGHAIAGALAKAGAKVTLVSGPVSIADPEGCRMVRVESASEMEAAVEASLPADIGVFVAAVADWRVAHVGEHKTKKGESGPPALSLIENPDILAGVAKSELRPALLIGFAAETENVEEHARGKRERKGCDWIVANDVGTGTGTFGGDENSVVLVTGEGAERWDKGSKHEVAERLVRRIVRRFERIEV